MSEVHFLLDVTRGKRRKFHQDRQFSNETPETGSSVALSRTNLSFSDSLEKTSMGG